MTDYYLEFAHSPWTRRIVSTLRLPIPMPPDLRRSNEPWSERALEGSAVVFGTSGSAAVSTAVLLALKDTGAELYCPPGQVDARLRELTGSTGCNLQVLGEGQDKTRAQALVFDASGITDVAGLRALYDFFNPLLPRLSPSGRVVLLARSPESADSLAATVAARAVEGFCRSLAKELGKKGATAQTLYVQAGAEDRLAAPLRFLLGLHSAYVSGQALRVTALAGAAEPRWSAPLQGKVALVTGAARGIGASIAETLAREGAKVVCLDRPAEEEHLRQVAEKIGGSILAADITDAAAPQAIAEALRRDHGGVDIVVHNAGVTRDKTLARMSGEWWDMVLNINLAAILRINEVLLSGVVRRGGRIVCVSSISGIAGNPGQTNYAASKAGIIGYVDRLSRDVAAQGITVNAVAPGFIETQMTAAIPFAIREVGRRLNSLSQGGLPQDVAEVITFFASPGAAGVTGQTLRVCGQSLVGA